MKYKSIVVLLFAIFFAACQNGGEQKIHTDKPPKNGYFKGIIGITLSEGLFIDGERHGCWIEYFGDEEVRRIINYDHGKKHGLFVELNRQGYIISQHNFKQGKKHGLCLDYILGKRIYHETYKDGLLHGEKKSFYEDSGRMRDAFIYVDGKKNGSATYYYINGKRMARYKYKNDLLHGEQLSFYDNGKLMSKETYNMAVKEGPAEEYNDNGKLMAKGNYLKDEKTGVWEYYDEEGKVIKTENFGEGK